MITIHHAGRFISGITGIEFNSYIDKRLIPNFYTLTKESTSLLFTRVIAKTEGSIFRLLELRRFNNSDNFNLTFSVKNVPGPDFLPVSAFVRVINGVASAYGKDDGGLGKVENDELAEIENNTWIGRTWLEQDKFPIPIMIGHDEGNNFSITFFSNSKDFDK
ncbi:hypothetical protein [Algoriphagus formosus]|uniref:hypothetical protein n=1 Tax=Algoriphagus formosus TaxID=2007308 RepID=UPI003F7073F4